MTQPVGGARDSGIGLDVRRRTQAADASFGILMEAGVIEKKLAGEMKELARFRNLLVDLYSRINHSRAGRAAETGGLM